MNIPSPLYRRCSTCLGLGLGLGSAAADAFRFGPLEVRGGNPALVIGLGARSDRRAIGTDNCNLVGRVDLLALTRRHPGALTTLAVALLLREESADPSVVDEVDSSAKGTKDDKVKEKATGASQSWHNHRSMADLRGTYIWGSKKLLGASTTLTVSL